MPALQRNLSHINPFSQMITFDTGHSRVAPEAEVGSAAPEAVPALDGGQQHPVAEEVTRVVRVDEGRVLNITVLYS